MPDDDDLDPATERPAPDRRDGTHYGLEPTKGAVVAEGRPERSARDPVSRGFAPGEHIPAAGYGLVDDAQGPGDVPQPEPGLPPDGSSADFLARRLRGNR